MARSSIAGQNLQRPKLIREFAGAALLMVPIMSAALAFAIYVSLGRGWLAWQLALLGVGVALFAFVLTWNAASSNATCMGLTVDDTRIVLYE